MHSAFDPSSPQARAVAHLWWWMFGVGGAVWIAVTVAMLLAVRARHGRRGSDDLLHVSPETHSGMERAVTSATFITILILVGFLVYDFAVGRALAQHPQTALTIELAGHQWWWEAQYVDPDPSKRVVTANEIHVPVGEPVQ